MSGNARMIRVLVFLVAAGLLALGVVWLADRPGQIAITWLGYRADTSVMVAVMAIFALAIAAIMLWSLFRFLLRSPKLFSLAVRERKRRRGYDAVSRGLIAIGAGDARAAQRHAANAEKSLPGAPLALLLRAQTAQLNGDRAGAEDAFRAMAERQDTRLLGLRGLYVEAQRRNDPVAARLAAEEAAKDAPALPWAGQAVLEFRCAAGDWEGALAILERHRAAGMIDRYVYRRQRAVLLTARALAAEEENRDAARTFAVDATKLAPELVPAAALAGRLLAEGGERRKAGRILEAAWKQNPHPDLAETYAHVRLSDSARDRLSRMQALARLAPGHAESALAVARAALDAREFATAREALAPVARRADAARRHADGRARTARGRRGPRARMDGPRAQRGARSGLDRGRLRLRPLAAGLAGHRAARCVRMEGAGGGARRARAVHDRGAGRARAARADGPRAPGQELPREVPSPPLGNVTPETTAPRAARAVPRAAPIIPLAAIPDDPGPEPQADTDAELAEPKPPDMWERKPWQRIRQLFR